MSRHIWLHSSCRRAFASVKSAPVHRRVIWMFYLSHQVADSDFAAQGQHEHEVILDALRSGNDRLAEALTSAHIEAGRAPTVRALAP
jgi:DNA-binding GntR family transcriptional regulator